MTTFTFRNREITAIGVRLGSQDRGIYEPVWLSDTPSPQVALDHAAYDEAGERRWVARQMAALKQDTFTPEEAYDIVAARAKKRGVQFAGWVTTELEDVEPTAEAAMVPTR